MSTARQLLYQKVEGAPSIIYSAYIENMRQLRAAPNYWRFVDTKSWVDGPPGIQVQFTKHNIVWKAEIDPLDDTKVHLYNETDNAPGVISFTLQHTETIVAVSLEFDQVGRPLIVYEDTLGNINLYWYNPVLADTEQTVLTAGITPHICSTRYFKTQGSADSERIIFYCNPTAGTVHYRRQDDRYTIEYDVDPSVTDVLEVIAASKNIYGGLTVVAARQNVDETVELISWTARQDATNIKVIVGSDRDNYDVVGTLSVTSATLPIFSIADALIFARDTDTTTLSITGFSLADMAIQDSTNTVAQTNLLGLAPSTATTSDIAIVDTVNTVAASEPLMALTFPSVSLGGISIQAALVTVTSYGPDLLGLTSLSGTLSGATIG